MRVYYVWEKAKGRHASQRMITAANKAEAMATYVGSAARTQFIDAAQCRNRYVPASSYGSLRAAQHWRNPASDDAVH